MNIQERFNYYIKNWKDKQTFKIPDHAKVFKQNELIYYTGPNTPAPDNFPFHYGCWKEMFWRNLKNIGLDIPCLSAIDLLINLSIFFVFLTSIKLYLIRFESCVN